MATTDLTTTPAPVSGDLLERFEGYAFRVTELSEYHIEFEVSELDAECSDGSWLFWQKGASTNMSTYDFADAERVLTGGIKWDGCSNWDFHTGECARHFCGLDDALSIGRLLGRLYAVAAERIVKFDHTLAGMRP